MTSISCRIFDKNKNPKLDDVAARAYENYLLKSELPDLKSSSDSIKLKSAFINKWLKEQVAIKYAKENLSSLREEKINREVEKFKNELLVYEYESQLADSKFKNKIKEEDLFNYYKSYLDNFVLTNPIVKLLYLKVDKKVTLKDKVVKEWMTNSEQNFKLNVVCNEYLMDCHLDTTVWIPRKYILDRLKGTNISESNLKGKATFVKVSSVDYNLYLYIIESREEGQSAPFQYIRKEIEKLFYKKMKSNFIEETKKAMFEKAIKDNEVEVF